jgi:azurin
MNLLFSVFLLALSTVFTTTEGPEVVRTDNRVEITIESNDQMKFNLSEITVKEGETVVLTLKHVGKLPKAAMGHNWVLLTEGADMKAFAMEAMKHTDNDYIPTDTEDVIVHTDLLGGGEETTIEFTAPAAGEYTFICSFPGHYALMNGTFVVQSAG